MTNPASMADQKELGSSLSSDNRGCQSPLKTASNKSMARVTTRLPMSLDSVLEELHKSCSACDDNQPSVFWNSDVNQLILRKYFKMKCKSVKPNKFLIDYLWGGDSCSFMDDWFDTTEVQSVLKYIEEYTAPIHFLDEEVYGDKNLKSNSRRSKLSAIERARRGDETAKTTILKTHMKTIEDTRSAMASKGRGSRGRSSWK